MILPATIDLQASIVRAMRKEGARDDDGFEWCARLLGIIPREQHPFVRDPNRNDRNFK